jgi:hypothetical protein
MRGLAVSSTLAVAACAASPGGRPSPDRPATTVVLPAASVAAPPPTPVAAGPSVDAAVPSGAIVGERVYGGDAAVNGGALAIDSHGSTYVVGSFRGTSTFGALPALVSQGEDVYFVKLAPDGEPVWSKRFGGKGFDSGLDVVVDAEDDVIISGFFESPSIDLGRGALRCRGIHDIFLAKFTGDGALLWAKSYGDDQDQLDARLRLDPAGGVVVTGWFRGSLDFGAGPIRSLGNRASYVARIDGDGRARWSKSFGHMLDYAETDSAFDPSGNLLVSSGSDATSEFVRGGHPAAKNDLGPVLLTFAADGKRIGARRFGSEADNLGTKLEVDARGSVRIVATSRGAIDFGGGAQRPPPNEESLVVANLDPAGALTWMKTIRSSVLLSVAAAQLDGEGNLYLVGQAFERVPGSYQSREPGFVVKLDASGDVVWMQDVQRGPLTWMSGAVIDGHGRLVVAGTTGRIVGNGRVNGLLMLTIEP